MQKCRRAFVALLAAGLLVRPALAATTQAGARCASSVSGDTLVTTVPLEVNGQRFRLELNRSGPPAGPRTFSLTLSRHHQILLRSQGSTTPTGFRLVNRFGAGIRGLRSMSLTSTDGHTVTGTIDGRALEPFTLGGNDTTLAFADGSKAPKIRVKPFLQRALEELRTVDTAACTPNTATSGVREDFLGLDCTLCEAACGIALMVCDASAAISFAACEAGTVGIATLGCVAGFAAAEAGCLKASDDCSNNCETGSSCCPVPCKGGTPNAASSTEFCAATCSGGATCCGGQSNPNGVCCGNASDCCGTSNPTCLEGVFANARCVNPSTGAFCFADEGDVCGSTAAPGRASCCPGKSPVCRDAAEGLCCARGAGDTCGNAQERKCCPETSPVCRDAAAGVCCPQGAGDVCGRDCCPAGAPHCDGEACCKPSEACGDGGQCCPAPHICRGQTCCNPPSTTCGSACCNVDETCVDASKSLCCGILTGIACGDSCCDSVTEACVNGACCPRASACGSACCATGEYCESNGTCRPCPGGEVACRENDASSGPSTCCEPGQACCGSPLECQAPSVCAPPPPK